MFAFSILFSACNFFLLHLHAIVRFDYILSHGSIKYYMLYVHTFVCVRVCVCVSQCRMTHTQRHRVNYIIKRVDLPCTPPKPTTLPVLMVTIPHLSVRGEYTYHVLFLFDVHLHVVFHKAARFCHSSSSRQRHRHQYRHHHHRAVIESHERNEK